MSTYYMFPFIWKSGTSKYVDTESKLVVAYGWTRDGWE